MLIRFISERDEPHGDNPAICLAFVSLWQALNWVECNLETGVIEMSYERQGQSVVDRICYQDGRRVGT